MKRFIVMQTGARRNYAIPALLERSGMLEALYTDLCADAGIGAILDRVCPQVLRKGKLQNLLNRRVPPEVAGKVRTLDLAYLRYLIRQKLAGTDYIAQHQAITIFDREFGRAAIDCGSGKATHLYSMFGEGSDFLAYARDRGLKVVTEFYISFMTHEIVQKQRYKYPWLEAPLAEETIAKDYASARKICQYTDICIAPSQFVVDGLQAFDVASEKCQIVPYAVGDDWFEIQNMPQRGRILFVGTADLRKGIHILGMAARQLRQHDYEFRIAGGVTETIRTAEITQYLHFLGRVPRSEINQEYAAADIFVLPTFAEGSAEVVYEALAAGVPVITTHAAGSVVRDGVEGFIVPEGDADALAQRITETIGDRQLRERMAISARERARDYTWQRYAQQLQSVFQSV